MGAAPLVFYDAVLGALFSLVFFAWIGAELRWLWRRRAHGDAGRGAALSLIVFPWLGLWIAALLAQRLSVLSFATSAVFVGVGLGVAAAGLLLRRSAERAFSVLGGAASARGPYRYVRHPRFAASLVTMLGFGLALSNWASVAVCVLVPLAGYLARISVAESELAALFGPDYRRYARETARLVPGVW